MYDYVANTIARERVADLHREADQARLARVARAAWRQRRPGRRHYAPPVPSPRSA